MNGIPAAFVRIYSEAEIERQLRNDRKNLYENPLHLDSQRLAIAQADGRAWSGYLEGREELIQFFAINDEAKWKAYIRQARQLTDLVLSQAKVVFVTCDSVRDGTFLHRKKVTNAQSKDEEVTVAWPATSCIIDAANCANPLQILSLTATFTNTLIRLILAGDHLQLPPRVQNDKAKTLWPKSFFKDCIDKTVDSTLLNIQYRMHSQLFAAANDIIYKGQVSSFWSSATPRPFLADLQSKMPISVTADNRKYELTSFSNFIDVPHGSHQSKSKGSMCNDVSPRTPGVLFEEKRLT